MKDNLGREIPRGFTIVVRRDVLAESLWEYGEDSLAERVLEISDGDLRQIHRLAVWHHFNDPEPESGPKLTNGRIVSRAAIEFFERETRDTRRQRRRTRPAEQRYSWAYSESLRLGSPLRGTPAERGHYPGWHDEDRAGPSHLV